MWKHGWDAKNYLVLISDHTKSLYDDKWTGDILNYTGMGKSKDQSLDFMQNKTLAQSRTNGIEVHLFEVLIPRQYIYQGRVTLVGEPYQEVQNGDDGIPRKVWMFPLKLNNESEPIPEEALEENIKLKGKAAHRLSLKDLKRIAEQNESDVVSSRKVMSNAYIRDVSLQNMLSEELTAYVNCVARKLHSQLMRELHTWNVIILNGSQMEVAIL